MAKAQAWSVANQKRDVGKSTTVYNLGAGLAMSGKKVLALDVDPQGDLTKMLGQRRPHELPLTRANSMNDVLDCRLSLGNFCQKCSSKLRGSDCPKKRAA